MREDVMKINTEVKEVQIYRNRCTVIRNGMIPLKAGRNVVEIEGMSTSAMIDTVRMNFPSFVKAVMIRVIEGKNGPKTEELSRKIRRIELKKKALKEQADMWKPEGGFSFIKDMSVKDMEACIKAYPWRMEEIDNKIQDLDNEQNSLEKELRKAVEEERRPLVQAELMSDTDAQCLFEMRYQDGNAGWRPKYEIHTDGKNSDVRFIMKADVNQNTGEDWNQVKLSVCTGNPAFFRSLPKLRPVYLDLKSDETTCAPSGTTQLNPFANTFGDWDTDTMSDTCSLSLKALDMNHAEVIAENTTTEYRLPSLYTVPSGYGEGFSCDLCEFTVHAEYVMQAIPKQNRYVYLCAQLKRDDMPVAVNGWVDIYLNGTYTANVHVDCHPMDEMITVPLGAVERISITRDEKKKKASGAMIRNQRSCVYEININVTNLEENDISLEIMDQIPVSRDQGIYVDLISSDYASYDCNDGTLRWKLDLKSGQTKAIHVEYRVLWPKDREIEMSLPYGYAMEDTASMKLDW